MKKFLQVSLLSIGLAGFGLAGLAAEQKIATFNLTKAFNAYYKTIQATVLLNQEVTDAKKAEAQMIESARKIDDDYRKLVDKATDQAVSAEEREKSKKAMEEKRAELEDANQSISERENRDKMHIQAKEEQRTAEIVKEIVGVVEARAKAAGYTMVLDASGTTFNHVPALLWSNGQDDLTDSIIKELNAAAPPGSLDTNAPAGASSNNLATPINTNK